MKANSVVIVSLHSPKEKVWGILDELIAAGITLRGIDLSGFEEWLNQVGTEEFGEDGATAQVEAAQYFQESARHRLLSAGQERELTLTVERGRIGNGIYLAVGIVQDVPGIIQNGKTLLANPLNRLAQLRSRGAQTTVRLDHHLDLVLGGIVAALRHRGQPRVVFRTASLCQSAQEDMATLHGSA